MISRLGFSLGHVGDDHVHHVRLHLGRDRALGRGPVEQIGVVMGQQGFESLHLGVGQRGQMVAGEGPEQNIVLVGPHMVGAKHQAFKAIVHRG